jgi:Zn-dependent M28 family amino/carboxypeptidase
MTMSYRSAFVGFLLATTPLAAAAPPAAAPVLHAGLRQQAARLRDEALKGTRAYEFVASLSTEIGPRLAGSRGDKAAVKWGLRTLRELGFANVRAEAVTVPHWERGRAEGEILAPFPQVVALAALGGSVGTADEGVEAEVVAFDSQAALETSPPDSLGGKIVFINGKMIRSRDGAGYGATVEQRSRGAIEAAKRGAVAVLIRSVGTDANRTPHTGGMRYDDAVRKIPGAALAIPDADLLEAEIASGKPVRFRLRLTARALPDELSANVIGEVPGRDPTGEIVLLGCHLDSWDLGTGAIDDGAGCGIAIETGRRLLALPQRPRRTVRIVLFANEEFGLSGAKAYAEAHKEELARHALTAEADLGSGKVYRLTTAVAASALPAIGDIARLLQPLGVALGENADAGGADISPMRKELVPAVTLAHDATTYFDFPHPANDTLDKVDRGGLDQSVAAYLTLVYAAAESEIAFGPGPPPPPEKKR